MGEDTVPPQTRALNLASDYKLCDVDGEDTVPPQTRALNAKFLAGLIVVTALLSCGVHLLHGAQVKRNVGVLKRRAEVALKAGNLDEAAAYLDRYLGFRPDDLGALTDLGLTLDKLAPSRKQLVRIYFILDRVVASDPERVDLRRRVAQIAMDLERYSDAQSHLEILLDEAAPADPELEQQLARCYEASGQYAAAVETYEMAIGHAPNQIASYERLAILLRKRLDKPKEVAERWMNKLVANNDQSFQAYLSRARYHTVFDSLEDERILQSVVDDVNRARELAPDEAAVLLAVSELALNRAALKRSSGLLEPMQADVDEGRWVLQRGLELYPEDIRVHGALANLERRWGKATDALNSLRQALELFPGQPDLMRSLADLLIDQGDLTTASQYIDELRRNKSVPRNLLQILEARVVLREDSPSKWRRAAALLEEVRPTLAKQSSDLIKRTDVMLGECYAQLLDSDRQLAAFRRAAKVDPSWPPAQLGIAATLAAQGQIDAALVEYKKLVRIGEVPLIVARLLLTRNLQLPNRERDWHELDAVLERASQMLKDSPEVPLVRSQALAARGQFDLAMEQLKAAQERHPDNVLIWTALAGLSLRSGQVDDALRTLDRATAQLGDRPELRVARAQLVTHQFGEDALETLTRLGQGLDAFSSADQLTVLAALAQAHSRLGRKADAIKLWEQAAQLKPSNLQIRLQLVDLAVQMDDQTKFSQMLQEIRDIEGPGGPVVSYCQAAQLVSLTKRGKKQDLAQARAMLQRAAASRPRWASVARLQAEIDDLEGDAQRALENYQRAIAMGERNIDVLQRAVLLLHYFRRFAEANQILDKLDLDASVPDPLLPVAPDPFVRGESSQALRLATKAVEANPTNYRQFLWLGQVHWSVAERKRAEHKPEESLKHEKEAREAFEHAVELAENRPSTWVTLVSYLAQTGNPGEAEDVIKRAQTKLTGNQSAVTLAQCYEAVNDNDRAHEEYLRAIEQQPDDADLLVMASSFYIRTAQYLKAEQYLHRIVHGNIKASPGTIAWARRYLAGLLIARAGSGQVRPAAEPIDGNVEQLGRTAEDLRVKARLLAQQNSRRRQLEAIAAFEDLSKLQSLNASDKSILAPLYEEHGFWPKARELFHELLTADSRNAAALTHYVLALLRQGEKDEARTWLSELEEIEPDSFRTIAAKARVLAADGKGDEAVNILNEFLGSAVDSQDSQETNSGVAVQSQVVASVASLLEELGQLAAAESAFRQYVSLSQFPEAVTLLVEFLGRQARVDEALDLCESAWDNCSVIFISASAIAVVGTGKATEPQLARVDRLMQAALEKEPISIPLLMRLAELRHLQDRYDDSAAVYQRIVSLDDHNVIAMNNLAWLLASSGGEGANRALVLVTRAIEIGGPTPELLDTRSSVNLALGRIDDAIRDAEEAVDLVPSHTNPAVKYFHLAQAYQAAQDQDHTRDALEQATASGLDTRLLHPREHEAYRKLIAELGRPQ